jgi:hypothetical protein
MQSKNGPRKQRTSKPGATVPARLPPYAPFRTFLNLLDGLRNALPSRIDRGVMASFSGALQGQLFSTLKSLDLIDEKRHPSARLKELVQANTSERRKLLGEVLHDSYPYLFAGDLDITTATHDQVAELFKGHGATGETVRKCLFFFILAANYSELTISPHLKSVPKIRHYPSEAPRDRANNPTMGISAEGMMVIPIFLGRGRFADIRLPEDITSEEGEVILQTLPIWFGRLEKEGSSDKRKISDGEDEPSPSA